MALAQKYALRRSDLAISTAPQKTKKRLSGPFASAAKRVFKLLHRVRKLSARQLSQRFPALSRRLQRLRHRKWTSAPRTSQSNPIYPDFVILGAPKCGTSWLQGLLGQHPKILIVPDEIEYFSLHLDHPVEWYSGQFARRLASIEGAKREAYLFGEKSARYCSIAPDVIQHFHDLLPNARLILMARDPVSRHWSHCKKYFAKRRLRNPDEAVLSLPRPKLFDFFREMRPLGEFSKIIANWTSVYPSQQLLVVSQEGTLASPRVTLDAVLQHIGLSTDYDVAAFTLLSRQRNIGPRVDMPDDVAEFLADMFAEEQRWLQAFFGGRSFSYAS